MCDTYADKMSCDAQTVLAKQEVLRNAFLMDYVVNHPMCNRFNEISDKALEASLLQSQQTGLKICDDNPNITQDGPWTEQFSEVGSITQFDRWTRAKSSMKPCVPCQCMQ